MHPTCLSLFSKTLHCALVNGVKVLAAPVDYCMLLGLAIETVILVSLVPKNNLKYGRPKDFLTLPQFSLTWSEQPLQPVHLGRPGSCLAYLAESPGDSTSCGSSM